MERSRFWTILSFSWCLVDEAEVSISPGCLPARRTSYQSPDPQNRSIKNSLSMSSRFPLLCSLRDEQIPPVHIEPQMEKENNKTCSGKSFMCCTTAVDFFCWHEVGPLDRRAPQGESQPAHCAVSHKGFPTSRDSSADMWCQVCMWAVGAFGCGFVAS